MGRFWVRGGRGCRGVVPAGVARAGCSLPWIDSSVRRLVGGRGGLCFRARGSSGPDVGSHYKRFRAHVQKVIGDACWKHISNIFSFEMESPGPSGPRKNEKAKKFWSFVKSLKGGAFGVGALGEGGVLKTDTLDEAGICNGQFRSAFTRESGGEIPSKGTGPFTPMGEITVDPNGVFKLLNNLKIHKAPGPDGLSARVLKECSSEIAPILALICDGTLAQGTVPDGWRQANVAPIFKKGEKYDAAGCGPVSLACICCKTLEHIIVSNINKHLAFESILADCRHGFRGRGSCGARLVRFFRDLVGGLDRALSRSHRQTDVIVVGFAGAFDKVPHRRLLCRLGCCGIRGSARGWIASWLSGRFRRVVLDGQASGPVPILSSVPQGSVLGPVLFLIFINDLPEGIGSPVRLFADGCVLCGSIGSPAGCRVLQGDLSGLARWEAGWRVGFNVAGCHSMRVTRHPPDKHIQFEYTLRRRGLERVQSAKCLGITISDDLDWGQHISEVSSGAAGALGFLRRGLAFAPGRTGEVACGAS